MNSLMITIRTFIANVKRYIIETKPRLMTQRKFLCFVHRAEIIGAKNERIHSHALISNILHNNSKNTIEKMFFLTKDKNKKRR